MEHVALKTSARSESGSRAAFKLRRAGQMPAIVYGAGQESLSVSIDTRALENALRHHERVFTLNLEGGAEQMVLLQSVQYDSLGDSVMHVDFLRISKDAKVDVEVEIEFVGHPKGQAQGEFVKNLTDLPITCAPAAIPDMIRLLVTDLDVGDTIYVKDLELPEGVEVRVGPDEAVCGIHAIREEEEAEEGEEGESAEPEVIAKGKKEEEPEA